MRVFLLRREAGNDGIYHLSQKERNYLCNVLRLSINSVFTAKDSKDRYYRAFLFDEDTLTLEETDRPEATLLDGLSSYQGPFVPLSAFVSVLKGRKNEMEVRALTEIGVRRIVLMETEFTQSPLSGHDRERLSSIVREAVQQSGSSEPEIRGPLPFSEALDLADGRMLILHQSSLEATKRLSQALSGCTAADPVSFLIGPEGGFSEKECSMAIGKGAVPILLSTNILRAETAAIYTASAIQALLQN